MVDFGLIVKIFFEGLLYVFCKNTGLAGKIQVLRFENIYDQTVYKKQQEYAVCFLPFIIECSNVLYILF